MRTPHDIFCFIMDNDAPEITEALAAVYLAATPEQGQHDLRKCQFCHVEEIWHGNPRFVPGRDNLIHKEDCPVGKVDRALRERE
jgi:hypothetical protein